VLKVVYLICCEVYVHKISLMAVIKAADNRKITTYKTKRFSSLAENLVALHCELRAMDRNMSAWKTLYKQLARFSLIKPLFSE
jgi:hypothetical protein